MSRAEAIQRIIIKRSIRSSRQARWSNGIINSMPTSILVSIFNQIYDREEPILSDIMAFLNTRTPTQTVYNLYKKTIKGV